MALPTNFADGDANHTAAHNAANTAANRLGATCRIQANNTGQTIVGSAAAAKVELNQLDRNDDPTTFTPDVAGGSSITVLRAGRALINVTCRFGAAASGERDVLVQINGASQGELGVTTGGVTTLAGAFGRLVAANDVITIVAYVDGASVALGTANWYQTGLAVTWLGDA